MPIIKSAVKRVRQTKSRTARNARVKRDLKAATKSLQAAIDDKQKTKLPQLVSELQSKLDTAVKKNLIPKNRAARIKSRYVAKVKAVGGKNATASKTKTPAKKTSTKKTTAKKTATKKSTASKSKKSTKK